MTRKTRAVVQTAVRTLEMGELPLPEIGQDDGLLRVEACGICGSDYEQYAGALARRDGRVVLAGTKGPKPVPDFYSDRVVIKELTIFGALGVDSPSYERAIRLIESGKYPLAKMHTHTLPLEEAERALRLLAGEEPGAQAIHIALTPSRSS